MPKFEIDADDLVRIERPCSTARWIWPPPSGIPWIDALGPVHDALKPRLRDLISRGADLRSSQILGTIPKLPDVPDEEDGPPPAAQGDIVGPCRLIRELGAGGMGTVWLAERHDGLIPGRWR